MKALVTGCFGFIGYNFILQLEKLGINYIGIDNISSFTSKYLYENFHNKKNIFIYDLININNIKDLNKEKIDVVFNFAAETHVDNSISNPSIFFHSNVNSLIELLTFSFKKEIKEVIHVSTDEVYGSSENIYFNEDNNFNPSSPYAASKASAEHVCNSFQKTYDLNIKIVRPANNYGLFQQPEKLIPYSIVNLQKGNNIELYGSGKQIRHWLHVEDTCKGILKVWENGTIGSAYNLGSGEYFQNLEVVKKIIEVFKLKNNRISYIEDRPGHDFRYAIDTARITQLGWKPEKKFKEELPKIVEWYIKNSDFWKVQFKEINKKRKKRFSIE